MLVIISLPRDGNDNKININGTDIINIICSNKFDIFTNFMNSNIAKIATSVTTVSYTHLTLPTILLV